MTSIELLIKEHGGKTNTLRVNMIAYNERMRLTTLDKFKQYKTNQINSIIAAKDKIL